MHIIIIIIISKIIYHFSRYIICTSKKIQMYIRTGKLAILLYDYDITLPDYPSDHLPCPYYNIVLSGRFPVLEIYQRIIATKPLNFVFLVSGKLPWISSMICLVSLLQYLFLEYARNHIKIAAPITTMVYITIRTRK